MKRKRAMSELGCELFNISFDNDMPIRKSCIDFRTIFNNLMTTDFDIKLQKNEIQMMKATTKMYSYLNEELQEHIGKLINNAITNIIIFILTDGNKISSLQQIKMNINFYYKLANNLYESGDHNSAIIIRAAINNSSITRLKIKQKKIHLTISNKFDKEYGTFINCHADHLKQILKKPDCEKFLPSLMVLMTHLNKTKEYIKSYSCLGKFPKSLQNIGEQLNNVANIYYNRYKDTNDLLLKLYTFNSIEHPIIKKYNCKNEKQIPCILHTISNDIKKKYMTRYSVIGKFNI